MDKNPYKEALSVAQSELIELNRQREELDQRIARLRETVFSLSQLVRETSDLEELSDEDSAHITSDIGFTDSIREVLKAGGTWMTPIHVRDGLLRTGYPLDTYTNPLASIHTVLKRLVNRGEIEVFNADEATFYRWIVTAQERLDRLRKYKEAAKKKRQKLAKKNG